MTRIGDWPYFCPNCGKAEKEFCTDCDSEIMHYEYEPVFENGVYIGYYIINPRRLVKKHKLQPWLKGNLE